MHRMDPEFHIDSFYFIGACPKIFGIYAGRYGHFTNQYINSG